MKEKNFPDPRISEILFSSEEILEGIKKLALKMNQHFAKRRNSVIFVGILKGCLPFMMELIKHIDFDPIIDLMVVSSYSGRTKKKFLSPKLVLDLDTDISGKDVVIIEDIIETGKTLKLVSKNLQERNPASVSIASLVYKKIKPAENIFTPTWYVFESPNKFLVGFGLDYKERMRNISYIGVLKSSLYEN
ncbi:MAG: hypoxanthine phosphoribosyltransferase [Mollicutes bacterium]|nr:MAG: hypoxanthine phosphoribosyltransferase [Mollicutes bacterium]